MTTASATASTTHAPSGQGALAGTGTLLRFMLRRDRIRLPVWVIALAITTVLTASSFTTTYPEAVDREIIVATMENPAMVAMVGVNYAPDDYTYGVMMGHQMLWFTAIVVGIMSVLLLVRHTRVEEATGRAELVRSGVVGRHAATTAALILVTIANLAVGLFMAVGLAVLGIESIDWQGSLLYGLAHAAVGLVFAGVAAVTAQVTEHSRSAVSMALAVLGLAYVLRAIGDITGGALSWLSPIGWSQATEVYAANVWWPLLLAVAATAALTAIAFKLSTMRDVGAGLRQPKPGPATASDVLTNPFGFALRLHRASIIGWAIAILLIGVSYGSILGEVEQLFEELDLEGMLPVFEGIDIVKTYASMVTTVTVIIASAYAVLAMQKLRSEETAGRAEPLLVTGLSRTRWVVSHVVLAMAGSTIVLLAGGVGIGVSGAIATGDASLLPELVGAFLAYLPAPWFIVGVSVALFGLLPRLVMLTWAVVVYGFVVVYLGGLLGFPSWLNNLSPFGHVPQLPAEAFSVVPLLLLMAAAGALVVVGLWGFGRRDLQSPT